MKVSFAPSPRRIVRYKIDCVYIMLSLQKMYRCATYYKIMQGKKVIHEGISRPNAGNMFFTSVHAEIKAALWLKRYGNMRRIRVIIWRIEMVCLWLLIVA